MRAALAVAFLALALLALPPAHAQVPSPMLAGIRVTVPTAPVDPGAAVQVTVQADRVCPSAVTVLDAQDVHVVLRANGSAAGDGGTLHYEQQVCAQQPRQTQSATGVLAVPRNATRGQSLSAAAILGSSGAAPTTGPIPSQTVPFLVEVSPAPTAATTGAEPARDAPGLGAPLAGLAALAFAGPRRPNKPQ